MKSERSFKGGISVLAEHWTSSSATLSLVVISHWLLGRLWEFVSVSANKEGQPTPTSKADLTSMDMLWRRRLWNSTSRTWFSRIDIMRDCMFRVH